MIHFGQLGDVVLGLPALRAIRKHFPDAKITVMSGTSTAAIIRLGDVADELIAVDRVKLRDGNKLASIAEIGRIVKDVRRRKFDLVIDLNSLYETNLLGFLSGANWRLYANRENRSLDRLSNFVPKPPPEDKAMHASARYLEVLLPLGIGPDTTPFRFQPREEDLDHVERRFEHGIDGSIGIFPGAGNPSRCWSLTNFAELARRIEAAGRRPVVFLGPEEGKLKDDVIRLFPPDSMIVDGLNIPQFIAALSLLSAFVCNDTGPVHLAGCTGVPIVLLMDSRAPVTYLPLADELRVVRNEMIDRLSVDEVDMALNELLESNTGNDKSDSK